MAKWLYSGQQNFADGLILRGAELALIGVRNIETQSSSKPIPALLFVDYAMKPLPNYDYNSIDFGVIYQNGHEQIVKIYSQP